MLGVPVTLVGIALLVGGRLGGLLSIEQASFVVTLTGVVLIVAGRDAVRIHWFTLAYLLLMVPIWSYPIDRLQEPAGCSPRESPRRCCTCLASRRCCRTPTSCCRRVRLPCCVNAAA